jgi:hypothetical protein
MRTEAEVYRFTWRSSFDGDAVVRIGRKGDEIEVRWAYRRFRPRGVDDAPPVVSLTLTDWARLQDALIAANFWALDPDGVPSASLARLFGSTGWLKAQRTSLTSLAASSSRDC